MSLTVASDNVRRGGRREANEEAEKAAKLRLHVQSVRGSEKCNDSESIG